MRGPFSCLHVYVPDAIVSSHIESEGFAGDTANVELIDPGKTRDLAVEQIGRQIIGEMREALPLSRLRVDALGQDLAVHLLRRYSSLASIWARDRGPARGGLTGSQLRRVADYFEANLTGDLPSPNSPPLSDFP
jgi:hypothetical protein